MSVTLSLALSAWSWSSTISSFKAFGVSSRPELLSASEVQAPIQVLRVAVGVLAATTPLKFSADYKQYTERVQALIDVARSVLDRGLEPVAPLSELDEWKPFREP